MIKLFSEEVNPTFTSSGHNIITVESYDEVFFDVFEFEINGTKYIAEKQSEYRGNPVVLIPVVEGEVSKDMPFILMKGNQFDVVYNANNNVIEEDTNTPIEKIIIEEEEVDIVGDYKKDIFEEIESAKKLADEYAERVKLQKIEEANKSIEEKQQEIKDFFAEARGDLLQEFNEALINNRSELATYSEEKREELENHIKSRIEGNFSVFFEENNDRIKELTSSLSNKVDRIADSIIEEKVTPALIDIIEQSKDTLSSLTKTISNTLDETEQRVCDRIKVELEESKVHVDRVEKTIVEQHVELNEKVKKGVDKALGRVGNIKTSILHLEQELNNKLNAAKDDLKELCRETVQNLTVDVRDRVEIDINKNKDYINEARKEIYARSDELDKSVKEVVNNTLGQIERVDESVDRLTKSVTKEITQTNKKLNAIEEKSQQSFAKIDEGVEKLEKTLDEKIDDKTKNINDNVSRNVIALEEEVHSQLKENREYVENIERVVSEQNVELNNTVSEGISQTIGKVKEIELSVSMLKSDADKASLILRDDVDKAIESLNEKVDQSISNVDESISSVDEDIRKYYNKKIKDVKTEVKDLTKEQKEYFTNLIEESKQSLLEQVKEDGEKFKTALLQEAAEFSRVGDVDDTGDDTQVYNPEDQAREFEKTQAQLKGELEKSISDRFTNEISSLKKLIEFSSSGGSVAMQFADGGVMNGNLTVVGTISAREYLGITTGGGGGGEYLPLSGGTVDGDVTITGLLSGTSMVTNTLSANIIHLNTDPETSVAGNLSWNEGESTLDLSLDNDVVLQIGEEQVINVKAAEAIKNGQVVYASGAVGGGSGKIQVSLYSASSAEGVVTGATDELFFIGVATQDFAQNDFGYITTFGKVRDVVVETGGSIVTDIVGVENIDKPGFEDEDPNWEQGTVLYISTEAGKLTNNPPQSPNKIIPTAMVIGVEGNQRTLFVRQEHGYHIDELHDVRVNTPEHGDVLTYNSTLSSWDNNPRTNWYVNKLGNETDDASGVGEKSAWVAPADGYIHGVHSGCSLSASGGDLTLDVLKNGTSFLATSGIIASGTDSTNAVGSTAYTLTTTPTPFSQGDRLSFDITSFGGTGAKGLHTDILISWS